MALDLTNKVSGGNNLANAGAVTEYTTNFPFATSTEAVAFPGGSTSYLAANTYSGIEITGDQTYECWVKFDSFPGVGDAMYVFGKGDLNAGTASYRIGLAYKDGTDYYLQFMISQSGADSNYHNVTVTAPSTGTWYHLAWVWTSASHSFEGFLNGTSLGTDSSGSLTTVHINGADLHIGEATFNATTSQNLIGKVDDVRIWNTVRTQTQINSNKSTELVGNESGLVAYWPFESDLSSPSSSFFVLMQ